MVRKRVRVKVAQNLRLRFDVVIIGGGCGAGGGEVVVFSTIKKKSYFVRIRGSYYANGECTSSGV